MYIYTYIWGEASSASTSYTASSTSSTFYTIISMKPDSRYSPTHAPHLHHLLNLRYIYIHILYILYMYIYVYIYIHYIYAHTHIHAHTLTARRRKEQVEMIPAYLCMYLSSRTHMCIYCVPAPTSIQIHSLLPLTTTSINIPSMCC